MQINSITEKIIGAAVDVHRAIGPGWLESAYEACLAFELRDRDLSFERQKPLPLVYKGQVLDCGYRVDLIVEQLVVVEIKAVERLERVHEAQILSYLRLSGRPVGLLFNFHARWLTRQGLRRFRTGYDDHRESPLGRAGVPGSTDSEI